jgi:UDP-N-acetylglucosamine 2-epimerase (non-hydrolysing)
LVLSFVTLDATVHLVMGARPNFLKVAPLYHVLRRERWCRPILVHTGQHYDEEMSGAFLRDLGLPIPEVSLEVGSGSHAEQTAATMIKYERYCMQNRPDWVVVVGDVNSTLACALAAKKMTLPVAHLEAGLRSGDRTMPEEINRIATDSIADLFWTPSPDADANLLREGARPEAIVRVGNVMIDSFELMRAKIEARAAARPQGPDATGYGVVTLHRPANVDRKEVLGRLVEILLAAARDTLLVFPLHPRTRARLEEFGLLGRLAAARRIELTAPLGYIEFMSYVTRARFVITDSGGVQEETTYLGIPCLTLRDTTERPITVEQGTNRLVRPESLPAAIAEVLGGRWPRGRRPDLWDGAAAQRVARSLADAVSA